MIRAILLSLFLTTAAIASPPTSRELITAELVNFAPDIPDPARIPDVMSESEAKKGAILAVVLFVTVITILYLKEGFEPGA